MSYSYSVSHRFPNRRPARDGRGSLIFRIGGLCFSARRSSSKNRTAWPFSSCPTTRRKSRSKLYTFCRYSQILEGHEERTEAGQNGHRREQGVQGNKTPPLSAVCCLSETTKISITRTVNMSAKSKNNPTMKTRRLSTTDSTSSASYQRGFAASSAIKKQHDPTNKALWCGRILFLSFLCGAAAALGFAAHHYLSDSETELAEAQFESIADRALTEAAGITSRKRHAILTMASMVSEMHADADDWPFVFVKNFERITNNLLRTTSGDKMAFTPLVKPEELEDWEEFAYDFFYNKHEPPFPNTTAVFPFGRGVWGVRPDLQPPHNIFHDVGNTTYASPHQVLTPTLQTEEGGSPVLMYNFHSDPIRGKPIDDLIDCSTRRRTVDAKEGDCGVVSDMVVSNVPEAKDRGPGGVMFQPIYPANDPNATLVGIIVSPLVWEDILENIIPGQVSGVDAVLSTEQRAFTYHFSHGVAYSE